MKRCTSSSSLQSGISLIETLVAMLIFSFGVLGLVGLQARAMQIAVGSEDINRAALLANELGATMWNLRSVELAPATVALWQDRVAHPQEGGLPNGDGQVEVVGGVAEVTITWRPPNAPAGAQASRYTTQIVIP